MTPADVASIMQHEPSARPQEFIQTGSLGLDLALGGGWPVGHISELSGPPDSGKSTLAYYAIANAQKDGYSMAGLVDMHGTFNPTFAKYVGVDLDLLYIVRSLAFIPYMLKFCALVVVDPLLTYNYTPSLQGTTVLYTTEYRKNLGAYFATRTVRTGGVQNASARVALRATLREGVATTTFTVEEASFTRPAPDNRMTGKFDILDTGVNHALEVLDWAAALGAGVDKRGNWYYFSSHDTSIQGRYCAAGWLAGHPAVLRLAENVIRYSR